MRRTATLAALAAAAAVLVAGAGIALAQSTLTGGPTGSLVAVGSAAASSRMAGMSSGTTTHVLQTGPGRSGGLPVTVPALPTTEAAPVQRPTGWVPELTRPADQPLPSDATAQPAPEAPATPESPSAESPPAAAPPAAAAPEAQVPPAAPAAEPPPAAAPPVPDAPVIPPYATVLGWHGDDRVAYLTFDDGPGPATGRVLDILAATGVKATFCQIGQRVADDPAMTARVAAEGHTLCNHSWDHYSPFDALPAQTLDEEIGVTQNAILQASGVTARYFRAPEGRFGGPGGAVLQAGQRARTIPLGWGVDSLDWQKPGAPAILATVLANVSPGAVILLHDGGGTDREETIAALPAIIANLQGAGYTLAAMPADPAG